MIDTPGTATGDEELMEAPVAAAAPAAAAAVAAVAVAAAAAAAAVEASASAGARFAAVRQRSLVYKFQKSYAGIEPATSRLEVWRSVQLS